MEPLPLTHVGPYRLLRLLGSGGMGQVFAAVHEQMGQQVAVKLLWPAAARDPQLVARFLQEARALAQPHHPGVVRIFHCDRLGETVFLAMELLHGLSLREWARRQAGPAPLRPALALCRQIADVMVDVHAQGIVHRDLKPENVFLCPDEATAPGYRVKLLDFGIAKLPPTTDEALTTTQVHTHESSLVGTYTYMAPEQLRKASSVEGSADVYALGVLLFELLAGRTPFVSDEPVDIISAHVHEEPPPLRQFVPALPGALSAFIASMLAKDPAQRPTMLRCREMLGRPWEREQDACPVPGLAPFTETQAELFFGRKAETQALLALLEEVRADKRRWVQLEGPSGVGKSSLIQAGLLPRLKEPSTQGSPRWIVATWRPSHEPLRSLARALALAYAGLESGGTQEEMEQLLRRGAETLQTFVTAHTPEDCRLLLVLEPMEELFTLGAAECLLLDSLLSTALSAPDCPLRLLTSLRSDFLHRIEQVPSLARQLHQAARYPLLPMGETALAQVIQGMAWHTGLRLSEGLVTRMVHDTRSEGGRLPLLGHALQGLWALSAGAPLTPEHYERLGGVGGALAQQAELLLTSLGRDGRERAKWLLLELVQIGRGVPDTRRPRSRQEVLAAAGGDGLAEEVLLRLTGMNAGGTPEAEQGLRLVVLSGEAAPSQQRVDLVHETLLQRVPSLVAWLEHERVLLERHADLEVAAHAWELAGCPMEGLPTSTLLLHYRGGLDTPRQDSPLTRRMSSRAARFLQAAEKLERRHILGRRALVAASLVAGLLILFYAIRAEQARQDSEANLRQLIKATDDFVSNSDWELSWLPYTLDERRKMLRGFHHTLTSLPESERKRPEVRRALIKVIHRLADLSFHDEKLEDADRLLNDAFTHLPNNEGLLLALNHSKRGKVALAQGRWDPARHHFNEALELLTSEKTDDDRRTRAVSLSELAELELRLEHLRDAADLFERAISLYRKNTGTYDESLLALTLSFRGEVARKALDATAAKGYLDQALQLGERCTTAHAGNQFYRWVLARIHIEHAALQVAQNQPKAAEKHYREAQRLGQLLLEGEPPNKRYALVFAQALLGHERLVEGEPAMELRAKLCRLADDFQRSDGEDKRFRFPVCQSARQGEE